MNERLTDLEGLCKSCHDSADAERERKNYKKFLRAGETARHNNACATYLEKKYGERWELLYDADPEGMGDEFEDWLERKGEEGYD
jgi:hypothetical protein